MKGQRLGGMEGWVEKERKEGMEQKGKKKGGMEGGREERREERREGDCFSQGETLITLKYLENVLSVNYLK